MSENVGRFVVSRYYDHGTMADRLRVDRADPVVEIARELWASAEEATRQGVAYVKVDGDVMTIQAENQTVIYRRTGPGTTPGTYRAEWPD